ncbi:MAG: hypothetical protein JWL94_91 [Microbacteriaceae bacterium]|nr:hypothetical protein [Microbacteriaceae bacterium]
MREGEVDRLGSSLICAAEQLGWCSNDPVCGEPRPQNLDGLNLAACHSCLFASETSCDGFNLLLDRTMLVGSANGSNQGLLTPLVEAVAVALKDSDVPIDVGPRGVPALSTRLENWSVSTLEK